MNLLRCCVLILFATASLVTAQERIPLDGVWQLAPEPRTAAQDWPHTTAVPGTFENALGPNFDGVAWYRRSLPLQPEWRGAVLRVEFAAVATHAIVFCNGVEVGQHLGGWTPFRCDLTAALRFDGKDELSVRVDEKVGHNTQGFLPIIQPHFGGIWQSVTLCVDRGPVFDTFAAFAFGRADGSLRVRLPVLGAAAGGRVRVEVLDGDSPIASAELPVADGVARGSLHLAQVRPWSPTAPNLYGLRGRLLDAQGRECHRHEQRIGFRSLSVDGASVRWNGVPLSVRGVLHWGFSPPHFAPSADRVRWRRDLETFRSYGFNTLKCCLFVPPPCVYELCDELGILVWQEYPTWHPQLDAAHREELLREYGEFFAADGRHPSVAFRSITCETGHGAELPVVQALFDACHATVPDTLVVDDSSWIGWQRVTDFWDEHPYGNPRWFRERLGDFQRHLAEHGRKPLLLGECMAGDTWFDAAAYDARFGPAPQWFDPLCRSDQRRFAGWLSGAFGGETLASLAPMAREHAMRLRRAQIERLRRTIPEAGYVVSVARDFPKARMGLLDDLDRPKWSAAEWSWHGDSMLCLVTPDDARAFVVGDAPQPVQAQLVRGGLAPEPAVAIGSVTHVAAPARQRVAASIGGETAAWDLWSLPPFDDAQPAGVAILERLDEAALAALERGARGYLHVHGQKLAPRSESKWYLTGAPFAPPHPVHARLPLPMLVELQPFDLDGGRVMPWTPWLDQVDPILAFWETHDLAEVRPHLFAFDAKVGQGRLLVSCFDRGTPAGRYVEQQLLQHLAQGPAPQRSLSPATLAALHGLAAEVRVELPDWRFRTDAKDEGLAGEWHLPTTDARSAPWRDLRAGAHWENQAEDLRQYTGVAWYRVDFTAPAGFAGQDARLVFEGIDDSATVWLDGAQVAQFGDPATKTTVWLQRSVAELGRKLAPGPHCLVLRVVDHAGAGGLWKPVYATTGPVDAPSQLLQ